MAKIAYKTRGNSSPQNKERVYFASHPADFQPYFFSVCEDILATQNCAIYYDKEPDIPWTSEDMELALSRMQLIVIPVTARFLSQPSAARDVELEFALAHHIPVLPLIEEEGLSEGYSQVFGDMQRLDKNATSRDPAALPYEQRLEQFLSSVLLGNELAAQVRAAFDAYIFLSYRRMDRNYARELMRLIHQNDFCRDIAIWYDEFLVPGERFNQAIADALEKSGLFALVVTPNLLEPGNYVMTTEYKAAREAGKLILPAEMEPTDPQALRDNYDGIPAPTNARDARALSHALMEKLRTLAIAENDEDPKHLFFIGLAYLCGIDVEVDRPRGAGLIQAAANADLPEAMEKLSQMYRNGEGVKRNYETSARWLEKLANHWEKRFTKSHSKRDGDKMASSYQKAGYAWREMGRPIPAKRAYQKLLTATEQMIKRFGESSIRQINLSISYECMGSVCEMEDGGLPEAGEWYKKCVALREQLYQEHSTVQITRDLAIGYIKLGGVCAAEKKMDQARHWYEKAVKLQELIVEKNWSEQAVTDASNLYRLLGTLCSNEADYDQAMAWYQKALDQDEELDRSVNGELPGVKESLAYDYSSMGRLCFARKHWAEAEQWYRKETALLEQQTDNSLYHQRALSSAYLTLGLLCRKQRRRKEADVWFERYGALLEQMYREVDSEQTTRDLADFYGLMFRLSLSRFDFPGARLWLSRLNRLLSQRGGDLDNRALRRYQVEEYCDKAEEYYEDKKWDQSRHWYERALELWEPVALRSDRRDDKDTLRTIYQALGAVCQAENNPAAARDWYEKAQALWEPIALQSDKPEDKLELYTIYQALGTVCQAGNDPTAARVWYEKDLSLDERQVQEQSVAGNRRALALRYKQLGDLCVLEGNMTGARSYFEKSLALTEQLARETDQAQLQADLADVYMRMGSSCKAEGNPTSARDWYEKALTLYEQLAREVDTVKACENLAYAYFMLGTANPGNPDPVQLKKAEAITLRLVSQHPQNASYQENLSIIRANM
ncbi:MAG: TIR domain-containing protein [Oscillospiraceae bacterium]|nr:TIR domain-containing protein [Oscillospiraceae bacterium]